MIIYMVFFHLQLRILSLLFVPLYLVIWIDLFSQGDQHFVICINSHNKKEKELAGMQAEQYIYMFIDKKNALCTQQHLNEPTVHEYSGDLFIYF